MGIHKKMIDPAALASLTTGVLMVDFSTMHEAAEHILGHQIWTHEFVFQADDLKRSVLKQFPNMPTSVDSSWEQVRDDVRSKYGDKTEVLSGSANRVAGPAVTAEMALAKVATQ